MPRTPYHDADETPLTVEQALEGLRAMGGDFDEAADKPSHKVYSSMARTLRACWDTLCDAWQIDDSPASGWIHIVVKLRKQGKLNDREYIVGLVDGWLQQAEMLLVASDASFLDSHEDIHSSIWKNLKTSHGKLITSLSNLESPTVH